MQYSNHKSTTIWDSADYRLKVTNKNNCRCAIFCLQSLFEQCNSTHHFVLSVMQISVMPARKPSPISFGFWHWPCIYSSVFYHGWSRTHCARSHFSVSSPAQLHPAYNSSVTFSSSAVTQTTSPSCCMSCLEVWSFQFTCSARSSGSCHLLWLVLPLHVYSVFLFCPDVCL